MTPTGSGRSPASRARGQTSRRSATGRSQSASAPTSIVPAIWLRGSSTRSSSVVASVRQTRSQLPRLDSACVNQVNVPPQWASAPERCWNCISRAGKHLNSGAACSIRSGDGGATGFEQKPSHKTCSFHNCWTCLRRVGSAHIESLKPCAKICLVARLVGRRW
jgi:hypothetical protein